MKRSVDIPFLIGAAMKRPIDEIPFLLQCEKVVVELGSKHVTPKFLHPWVGEHILVYDDAIVRIEKSSKSRRMEVERIENNNPVAMVEEDGTCIRLHGEHTFIEDHVESLL